MTWRSTILSIWKRDNQPALRLRTDGALQIEVQALGRDGTTFVYSSLGVDVDGSPGLYRNARLAKQADGSWQWTRVRPDQWCSSYHMDSDGRWVFKTAPPGDGPLVWGPPKARIEPDGTVIAKGFQVKEGW